MDFLPGSSADREVCTGVLRCAPPPLLVFGRSTLKAQRTVQAKQTAGLISKMLRSVSKLRLSGHPGQPNSFEDSMLARGVVRLRGAEPGCFTLDEPTMFS